MEKVNARNRGAYLFQFRYNKINGFHKCGCLSQESLPTLTSGTKQPKVPVQNIKGNTVRKNTAMFPLGQLAVSGKTFM
jgi:hypothetical protein